MILFGGQQPLIYSLVNGSTLQSDMVSEATDNNINDEPVTPRKIPFDHTKLNTSDNLKSEMVLIF